MKRTREHGLDLVRFVAVIFVIAGHFFFLNTDFSGFTVDSFSMVIQSSLASLFYVSVPLFILLSGYLNRYKNYNDLSYKTFTGGGIRRVLFSYLFFSLLSIFYRIGYLDEQRTLVEWIKSVLNFSAIKYGWYVELYLGLFLLMPFLNILFHNLKTKKNRIILISICLICGPVPYMCNRGDYHLFPDYYVVAASIFAYYFIGLYISEYKLNINKYLLCLLAVTLCVFDALANFVMKREYHPLGGSVYSLYYMIIAVCVFLMLYNVNVKVNFLERVSPLTFDVYLCSWIFDSLLYPLVCRDSVLPDFWLLRLVIMTMIVYFSSLIVSYFKFLFMELLSKCNIIVQKKY